MSLVLLFTGCYTHTNVTKETPPADVEVVFRLHDGTRILSSEYQRVENGYRVAGRLIRENSSAADFSGMIGDEQIKEVVTNEFNPGLTVLWVSVGAAVFAVFVVAALSQFPRFTFGAGK